MGWMGEAWPNPAVGELVAGVGPPRDCLARGATAGLRTSGPPPTLLDMPHRSRVH